MAERQCYHCKQLVRDDEAHDCWTTTEAALTRDLSEDLREAWERLRETAADFGEQRIYASHHSIMFSRKSCYFFVRPKRSALEVCIFLRRKVKSPQIRRTDEVSRTKVAHLLQIRHRDEVESPVTDWLQEAYEAASPDYKPPAPARPRSAAKKSAKRKPAASVKRKAAKR